MRFKLIAVFGMALMIVGLSLIAGNDASSPGTSDEQRRAQG